MNARTQEVKVCTDSTCEQTQAQLQLQSTNLFPTLPALDVGTFPSLSLSTLPSGEPVVLEVHGDGYCYNSDLYSLTYFYSSLSLNIILGITRGRTLAFVNWYQCHLVVSLFRVICGGRSCLTIFRRAKLQLWQTTRLGYSHFRKARNDLELRWVHFPRRVRRGEPSFCIPYGRPEGK